MFLAMTSKARRVIGLDPGVARLGWAVIDVTATTSVLVAAGLLTTPSTQPTPERLAALHLAVMKLFKRFHPDSLSVEQVFFSKNVSTALSTGQVRGVVLSAAALSSLLVHEFTPTAVKQTVTGDGRADKQQIRQMVKILLHLKTVPPNDDTTDAMAIALCGAHTHHFA